MKTKHAAVLLVMAAMMLGSAGTAASAGEQTEAAGGAALRVGTFDTRAVALAYGRSEPFLASVRTLHEDAAKAREQGKEKRLAELEARGSGLQEELHRQVFGGAPIDGILAEMAGELLAIARAAGVDVIVQGVLYRGDGVEMVDITREMVRPFHPDEQTLKIMEDLMKVPPVEMD